MEGGASFADALARAQRLGYAESDPANDVEGIDAAHKLAVIAQLAFGLAVVSPRIRRAGIGTVTQRDVSRARMQGLRVRLVAAARKAPGGIAAEVAPLLVARDHEFANTEDAENAIAIVARDAGRLVLRGAGAGGAATGSAVLGDVVSVLRGMRARNDSARRERLGLEPAIDVAPLFERLARNDELPHLRAWDERVLDESARALVNA
jgi:homoserine dehydrogenase